MYLNTSFAIVVLSTLEKHHHEEMPGFSTKENYHWTAQQEKVPQSFIIEETMMLGCSQMSSMSAKIYNSEVFSVLKTLSIQLVQIVAQSLVTHMKNTLILEELKWFNLVNGSGNLPSLLQVTCLPPETHLKLSRFQVGVKKRYMKLNPTGQVLW